LGKAFDIVTIIVTITQKMEAERMRISGVTYAVRKTHKTRNIILTVIVLLLLALLALVVLSGYKSFALIHPDRKPIDTFTSNIVPEYRDISFRGNDNSIVLKGWLFQAKNSDKVIILVHSYGSNRLQFGIKTIDIIKEFLNKGYNVFTFDLRNSGESDGKDTTFGYYEKEDVKAAINYVARQGLKNITLMGFSTGASASILAAADSEVVDAVIADSPYADLKTYFSKNLDNWSGLPRFPFNKAILLAMEATGSINMSETSPLKALDSKKPPFMLLIHGEGDSVIPVENSIDLYRRYSELNPRTGEFWLTKDNGHATSYLNYTDEYMKKVFEFLDKVYPENK